MATEEVQISFAYIQAAEDLRWLTIIREERRACVDITSVENQSPLLGCFVKIVPTEEVAITAAHVKAATRMAENKELPLGEVHTYTDVREVGLRLQVKGKNATWLARWQDMTRAIGYASSNRGRIITAPAEARKVASTVIGLLRNDPNKAPPFIDAY